ncbi:hypothetical protein L227DRAFT_614018 [Lentinus tigrinus ALCF2SS1-6]|uniref:Uncharacterized protein n=1 Tax=Lentinus tigrinus ALCF2SS1-6 TaxID=1328759 RepID=A0A5C2S175_9APHY|nr:hypothetical protein L227DRAFT_614018 [Lentinus tigrinus ALCF2SS1-6]
MFLCGHVVCGRCFHHLPQHDKKCPLPCDDSKRGTFLPIKLHFEDDTAAADLDRTALRHIKALEHTYQQNEDISAQLSLQIARMERKVAVQTQRLHAHRENLDRALNEAKQVECNITEAMILCRNELEAMKPPSVLPADEEHVVIPRLRSPGSSEVASLGDAGPSPVCV